MDMIRKDFYRVCDIKTAVDYALTNNDSIREINSPLVFNEK